ncbi:MAG: mucoidy inhibitor MuiA family protein [Bacteroidota bacterium]
MATDSLEINSQLTEVTVFRSGAQLLRKAEVQLPSGRQILVFPGLSQKLDPQSIQLKATGDFTILSVGAQIDYETQVVFESEAAGLRDRQDSLSFQKEELELALQLGREELEILDQNRNFRGSESNLDPAVLRANTAYHRERLQSIRQEALTINRRLRNMEEELSRIANRLRQIDATEKKETKRVVVKIDNPRQQQAELELSYLATGAVWNPSYDLRVAQIDEPLTLIYRAEIGQQTGEDWEDVKLTLSTGNPTRSAVAPELAPWRLFRSQPGVTIRNARKLDFFSADGIRLVEGRVTDENGEPLIGASVLVEGTSTGAVTDVDGNYTVYVPGESSNLVFSYTGFQSTRIPVNGSQIDVHLNDSGVLMEEVVVMGSSRRSRRSARNQEAEAGPPPVADPVRVESRRQATTVVFEVELPYSIPSGSETETVELVRHEVPATYSYVSVPKIDPRAYLQASITNWEQYDLLSGETQLFFEGTYLGSAYLDLDNMTDTMNLSLGVDESIIIERNRQEDFRRGQFIGSKKIASRGWAISVRNTKSRTIKLRLIDQVPISGDAQIDIKTELPDFIQQRENSGIFEWSVDLSPGQEEQMTFSYEVRYPSDMRVVLE